MKIFNIGDHFCISHKCPLHDCAKPSIVVKCSEVCVSYFSAFSFSAVALELGGSCFQKLKLAFQGVMNSSDYVVLLTLEYSFRVRNETAKSYAMLIVKCGAQELRELAEDKNYFGRELAVDMIAQIENTETRSNFVWCYGRLEATLC